MLHFFPFRIFRVWSVDLCCMGLVAFYHLYFFFYWQYTPPFTQFFSVFGRLLPPPPPRPCWPKMIKCHPSTTPWRRAWPGMLPRYARPVRGGPPLWGGWRVTLNHFWSARSGEEEGWAWIAVHRGQHSCHVINEFEINVFATTRCYSLLATHLRVVVKTPTQPYLT